MDKLPQPQPIPPELQEMTSFATWFFENVKRQGFTVLLLVIAVWYFYQRDENRDRKLSACQDANTTLLLGIAERSAAAIEQNTGAIEQNTDALEDIRAALNIPTRKRKSIPVIVTPKGAPFMPPQKK